ncbi:uncharacterized protein LOC114533292 isoform X2 [Dendronephthya gigantea]|uniref:uncharacterized protein LOC114533292 isoform X2 n=1 Tax=Dendronephthya gigantea TaxID=151771 RepID=UPI00106A4E30|nr:uncharacterized protein LOC114533292 isoform X2 [Dendronephthya gigantea]
MSEHLETFLSNISLNDDDDEYPVSCYDVKEAFQTMTSNEDLDFEEIAEGFHTDLDAFMSVLDDYPSSENEDSQNKNLIKTSEHCVQGESMSNSQSENEFIEVSSSSASRSTNMILMDFDPDDERNKIIYDVPGSNDLSSHSSRKSDNVNVKKEHEFVDRLILQVPLGLPKESVGTIEKRNRNRSTGKKDVHLENNYSKNVATIEKTKRKILTDDKDAQNISNGDKDVHEVEDQVKDSQSSKDSDETLDLSTVEIIKSEAENPKMMVDQRLSSPTQNKVEQLVNDSKQTLKNLVEYNHKFTKTIRDPYDGDNKTEGKSRDDENKESLEKQKKFLAPQKSAEQLGWNSSDEDVKINGDEVSNKYRAKTLTKRRTAWTEDEIGFIRDGIRLFDVGDWAAIRDHFPFQDCHKNSVAIKDKYRNMKKNGETFGEKPKKERKKGGKKARAPK